MADSRRTDTPEAAARGPLSEHVPIRFPPETIATVQRIAEGDGLTVSAWIRREVEREVARATRTSSVERERDEARAALDDALTVLRELADFAGEATDNAYCSVIAQHARDALAELDPPERHAD